MAESAVRVVEFVTSSPGRRNRPERVALVLEGGRPPRVLTDPTREHPGDWLLVEQGEGRHVVYQRLAPETAHP